MLPWVLIGMGVRYQTFVPLSVLFIFLGISTRNRASSPDTDNYIDFINLGETEGTGGLNDIEYLSTRLLDFFSRYLSGELFIFISVIIPFILLVNIAYSNNKAKAYFFPMVFICTIYGFDLMTNAIRQNLALVIAMWALLRIRNHLLKLFILFITIMLHKSCLLILLLSLISKNFRPYLGSLALATGSFIIILSMISRSAGLSGLYFFEDILSEFSLLGLSAILNELVLISKQDTEMFLGNTYYFVYSGIIILNILLYYSFKVSESSWSEYVKLAYMISCYGVLIISFASPLWVFYRIFYVIYPLMIYVIYFSFQFFSPYMKFFGISLCIFSLIAVLERNSISEFMIFSFYS